VAARYSLTVVTSNCKKCSTLLAAFRNANAALVETGKKIIFYAEGCDTHMYNRISAEYQKTMLECRSLRKQILIHVQSHGSRCKKLTGASGAA
jgi:RNase P subunit RPR2